MGTTYLTLGRVWYGNGWDWCTDDRCIAGAGPVSVLAADDDTHSWCWSLGTVQTTGRWAPTLRVLSLAVGHRMDAGRRLALALTPRQLGMVLCVEMAGAGGAGLAWPSSSSSPLPACGIVYPSTDVACVLALAVQHRPCRRRLHLDCPSLSPWWACCPCVLSSSPSARGRCSRALMLVCTTVVWL